MLTFSPSFVLVLLLGYCGAEDEIIVREYVWHRFDDFISYGWKESVNGTTTTYSKPSEVDPLLHELNNNFTGQVWGWRPSEAGITAMNYTLNMATLPEYCGIVNASILMKFYLRGNTEGAGYVESFIYPACTNSSYLTNQCFISNSNYATWTTKKENIVLTQSKTFVMNIRLDAGAGLFLLDEVRLSYVAQQGPGCPNSCNHDCDYRGIDCHNYYTCIDQRYKEFRTCDQNLGLAFNPLKKSCDLMENVEGCHGPKPPRCVCEFRPHEEDCSLYDFCPNSCDLRDCEVRKCPNGLLWSTDAKGDGSGQQQCTLPHKALCFGSNDTISSTFWPTTNVETTLYHREVDYTYNVTETANDVLIDREVVWSTFKEFIADGWKESVNGTTRTYTIPTELDPKLYGLNENFTDEVWGWRGSDNGRTRLTYTNNLGTNSKLCGITSATMTFKYYLKGNLDSSSGTYIYPACTNYSSSSYRNKCFVSGSNQGTWSSITQNVVLSESETLTMDIAITASGIILLDEVRLSYRAVEGADCPYSCNHDCDYRAIDCHNFYTCMDGRYREFRTCDKNDGLAFNPETKSCDHMENVKGCEGPEVPPPQCVCEFRPHEENCSRHQYCPDTCHLDKCEERSCPTGLLWSVDAKGDGSGQQQCVPASMAVCFGDIATTTMELTDTTPEPTTTTPEPTTTTPEPTTTTWFYDKNQY